MRKLKTLFASLAATSLYSHAEVEAVNIFLHDSSTNYLVPAGKVLIIEHFLWAIESDHTLQRVSINSFLKPNTVGSFQMDFSADAPQFFTPTKPIRLVEGGSVSILFSSTGADWRDVMISGLLVDKEDLYASIPNQLESPEVTGGKLMAQAKFSSPRPRVTKVTSSTDLSEFSEDETEELTETTSPSEAVVAVDADSEKKFIKVEAIARLSE